jgi:hypothetical protein
MSNDQTIIACNIRAIDAAHREGHLATAESLFSYVLEVREHPDGYGFRLPLETPMLHTVISFIANERLCCPFFTFTLTVGEELWFDLSGPDEVKAYIKATIVDTPTEDRQFPTVVELEAAYAAAITPDSRTVDTKG